jgi:hypothetical protein
MASKKRMSLDALSRTAEFRSLSVRQQLWLQTYCQGLIDCGEFDPIFATRVAFDTEGENARTFSYQLLRNKKIQAALQVWRNAGKSARAIFLDELQTEIDASKPNSAARARLLVIKARMAFGVKSLKKQKKGSRKRN